MKKLIFALVCLVIGLQFAFSQTPAVSNSEKIINAGIGFGSTLYTGSGYTVTLPPLSVSYEQIIMDEVIDKGLIGVGGYIGYASYKYKYDYFGDEWGWNYSNFILGARGSFHYPLLDKLDTYTGLMLGYQIVSASEIGTVGTGYSASSSGLVWSWYAGGRYFFSDKFAGMLELGYGITYFNLGIAIKL